MKNQYVQSETGFNRFKWDHYSNMRFWLWKKTLWKQIKASFKKYHSPNWITWTTPDCHFIFHFTQLSIMSAYKQEATNMKHHNTFHNVWLIIGLTHFWPQHRSRNWHSWNLTVWCPATETKYKTPTRIFFLSECF